jgi:hypothetical protein
MTTRGAGVRPLIAILTSATLLACSGQASDARSAGVEATPLPLMIQGMVRVDVMTGPEAASMLGRMHGEDVAPAESYVGRYQSETGNATLYMSRFASHVETDSLLNEMSESIGEGSSEFAHHTQFEAGGGPIHMVLGQGQVHFFFAQDDELLWLAIDAALAFPALAQVLGVTEESLPDRLMLDGTETPPVADSSTTGEATGPAGSDPEGGE